jgi:hypothetical protein
VKDKKDLGKVKPSKGFAEFKTSVSSFSQSPGYYIQKRHKSYFGREAKINCLVERILQICNLNNVTSKIMF